MNKLSKEEFIALMRKGAKLKVSRHIEYQLDDNDNVYYHDINSTDWYSSGSDINGLYKNYVTHNYPLILTDAIKQDIKDVLDN